MVVFPSCPENPHSTATHYIKGTAVTLFVATIILTASFIIMPMALLVMAIDVGRYMKRRIKLAWFKVKGALLWNR